MTDGDDTRAVQVARLEGRVDGIERALARQEEACERRANSHVDTRLYESERATMRGEISTIHAEVAQVRMDAKAFEEKLVHQRRWFVAMVLIPMVSLVVVVVMGVLT